MAVYNINFTEGILRTGFGDQAQNDAICREASRRMKELIESGELAGGELLRINGAGSLPVCLVIGHAVAHLYGAVAWYDPKLNRYVVGVAHGDKYTVGDLIE